MADMKRIACLSMITLAMVLFLAEPSQSAMLVNESFESGFGVFTPEYDGSSVVTDYTAPDGTHDLRFTFPSGFPGGNAPDIVHKSFTTTNEIYSRWYFKLSSGYQFHPYEQKMVFYWGNISAQETSTSPSVRGARIKCTVACKATGPPTATTTAPRFSRANGTRWTFT